MRFGRRLSRPASQQRVSETTSSLSEAGAGRMILCENGLESRQGHHLNLVIGVRAELARRGMPLTVLSHVELEPALCGELDATPVFERSPYSNLMSVSRGNQIRSYLHAASKFAAGLRRVVIQRRDLLLVLTARPAELLGLGGWSWMRLRQPRAIVLNFMTDDLRPERTFTPPGLVRLLYRLGLTLLRVRVGRRRVLLTCASDSLASSLESQLHQPVMVSPVLKAYPRKPVRRDRPNPVIGFLGTPRGDKGAALLGRVIDGCAHRLPDARVVAQLPPGFRGPPRSWPANVDLVGTGLDRERYFELLGELDLVVLPYRSDVFGNMVSGVFAEAVAFGAPAVVPADTWMAMMIQRGRAAGVVFQDFDVTAIVDAIAIAEARLDALRRQAASLQAPWRAEQSISGYFEQLFGELGRRGVW